MSSAAPRRSGEGSRPHSRFLPRASTCWTLLACVPVWTGVILGIITGRWWTFGGERPAFIGYEDLAWIARWATCMADTGPLQAVGECGIAYPLPGVWIAYTLGFNQDHLLVVGGLLATLWAVAVTGLALGVTRRAGLGWSMLMLVSLVAPPSWLLLERGNLDIVVWILVLLSLWAMISGREWWASVSAAGSILLKIFPVGITLAFLVDLRTRTIRTLLLLLVPFICAVAVVAGGRYVSDLRPNPVGDAFGAFHLPYLARIAALRLSGEVLQPESITVQVPPTPWDYLLGALVFGLAVSVGWWFFFRKWGANAQPGTVQWTVGSTGVLLSSYLTGANFDYRLTFVALAVVGVAFVRTDAERGGQRLPLAWLMGALLTVSCWLGVATPLVAQVVGDVVLWVALVLITALGAQLLWRHWKLQRPNARRDQAGPNSPAAEHATT